MATWYRNLINMRLSIVASVEITGNFTQHGNTITASATFEKVGAQTLQNTRAFILLLEDDVIYGSAQYDHITRAAYEQAITLTNVGDIAVVTTDFTVGGGWNADNIVAVAWVQNYGGNKEIYQAASLEPGSASVDEPPLVRLDSGVTAITPNPFVLLGQSGGSATIRMRISDRTSNHRARLDVVDLNGHLVRNLMDGLLAAGQYTQTWNGRDARGATVGAGIYYIRFANGKERNSTRLVLMR